MRLPRTPRDGKTIDVHAVEPKLPTPAGFRTLAEEATRTSKSPPSSRRSEQRSRRAERANAAA